MAPACGPRGCDLGDEYPVGRLCVHDPNVSSELSVDEAAHITVATDEGFSACAFVHQAECSAEVLGAVIEVTSRFCVGPDRACPDPPPPSFGPVGAPCRTPPLGAGAYVVRAGDLELEISVPTPVPPGGICVELPP
jgi:hypothetical protein